MLNGEYIFYSPDIYVYGGLLLDSDYRPEVDVNTLWLGFLTVGNIVMSGNEWDQLRADIVEGFSDPQFDQLQPATDPAQVTSFAGQPSVIIGETSVHQKYKFHPESAR